jgi:iron-sulfur cluster insertion protein
VTEIEQGVTVIITSAAAEKVKELLNSDEYKDENNIGLRLFIEGGGCSGFNYSFKFEVDTIEDDFIFEKDGAKFIIDPISYTHIVGSTIDYEKKLMSEQFVITNPNAQSTCGCGKSFAV